jgi:protein ImuB
MIDCMAEQLSKAQLGVQQLEVMLIDEAKQSTSFIVGTSRATQSADHLRELVRARWEQVASPVEVTQIQMEAVVVSTLGTHQHPLFETGDNPGGEREFAKLVDRLSSRLGKQRVVRPRYVPDAQPELSVRWEPVLETSTASLSSSVKTLRPLRLLNPPLAVEVTSVVPDGPPIRCVWENRSHTVSRCWGPERIETGWWRERHIRRDYYRIETESGQRFWLFRNLEQGGWFLHGEFE